MDNPRNTVIIAEDEPLVRMLAAVTFDEAGYDVLEAAHSVEAMAALEEHHSRILVLFTDIHMPGGCDGLELAHSVFQRWPSIALLLTSGERRLVESDMPPGGLFIAKPYKLDHVVGHVRAFDA